MSDAKDLTSRQIGSAVWGRRQNPERFNIRFGKQLKPWMLEYAHWLVNWVGKGPTPGERRAKLAELTLQRVNVSTLHQELLKREDFQAYLEEISRGPLEQARAKYVSDIPHYVEGYRQAFDSALSDGDYRVVAEIGKSAIDRVMPKKEEVAPTTTVVINVSARQSDLLHAAPLVVETELVDDTSPRDS